MTRFALVILTLTAVVTTAFAICSASSVFHNNPHSEFPTNLQLIAVGGNNRDGNLADVDAITLSSNTHMNAAPLPTNISSFGSTMVNGSVYVVGGDSFKDYQNNFFAYNVAENIWTTLPDFPFNISANALVATGNAIYSFGGYAHNDYGYMNYTYKYDLNERVWSKLPALLPVITIGPCVVADSSNIYYLHSGDLYRTSDGANTWTKLSSMLLNRNSASCAFLPKSNQILVAGGTAGADSDDTTNAMELYDIATDTWKAAARMNRARDVASAAVVPGSGDVVVCGGENYLDDETYADCELYSATKNQWNVLKFTLNVPRRSYGLFATQV